MKNGTRARTEDWLSSFSLNQRERGSFNVGFCSLSRWEGKTVEQTEVLMAVREGRIPLWVALSPPPPIVPRGTDLGDTKEGVERDLDLVPAIESLPVAPSP